MPETAIVLKDDVIKGFSYSFSAALLRKLKELREEKRIFRGDGNGFSMTSVELTDMAVTVMSHLSEQISHQTHILRVETKLKSDEVDQFINFVEEFLAIFQKKG